MRTDEGAPFSLRVAELLVPLSLVTDLGMAAPDGQAARACLLATGLARRLGVDGSELADVYYTTLLKHLGCTATAHEEASHLAGDESWRRGRSSVERTRLDRAKCSLCSARLGADSSRSGAVG